MRKLVRLLTWLAASVFLCCALSAGAGSEESPVTGAIADRISLFINTQFIPHLSGMEALTIRFCDSQAALHTPVGQFKLCVSPNRPLKLAGHKTDAVKIDPPIAGEWRFADDYALTFTPKHPWRADTEYTVTLMPGLFPPHVKLKSDSYDFSTQPFYVTSKSMDYMQDPDNPQKKLVNASLDFNYPVDRKTVQKSLAFTIEGIDATQSSSAANDSRDKPVKAPPPFTVAYDNQDTRVNVTVPVEKLTKDAQFMDLALSASLRTADGSGELTMRPGVKNDWAERVLIPSLYDYLQISSMNTDVLKDAHYVPQQVMVLESNTAVNPGDISRFVELHLLPRDKPVPDLSPKKDYAWSSPSEVTPEMRATLPTVPFSVQQASGEPSRINALNFTADGGRYLLVTVKKGLPAPGGYELGKEFENVVLVPDLPREIKVMAEGALLSLSGEKALSVMSLGVGRIAYEIGRVKEEDLSHLISQTRGNFAHPQFNEPYAFNEHNLSHVFREIRSLENRDPRTPNFSSFDFAPYLKEGKGLFFLTLKSDDNNPEGPSPVRQSQTQMGGAGAMQRSYAGTHRHRRHMHPGYASSQRVVTGGGGQEEVSDQRFILLTDLGLIVKQNADGTRDVFVQSIAGGGPVADVGVEVLGLNGEPVAEARTDGEGHASLPNLDAMKDEKQPVAFVARKGDDLSFLPYGRQDRELNYSRFDVDGNKATEGMQAYLFSDRGIYRPGETAHIGMIVKARDWSKKAAGLPLVLEVTNPHGQTVNKQVLHLSDEGLMAADFAPSETAATGVYNAALYLGRGEDEKGSQLGSVSIRVEEFQPDRMKMTSAITQADKEITGLAWVKPEALKADVTLMQLYGAPAKGRRVTAKLALAPGAFGFETYKDYSFSPEGSVTKSFDETLPETVTDENGKAHFALSLEKYKTSTFRLTFLGEGFEPDSGKSVKTAKSVLVSPLDYVLGVKPDGNLNYISPGDARSISLIAVDASLKKITAADVTGELRRVKNIQSLTKDEHGNYDYQSSTVETPVKTDAVSIGAEGAKIDLPTREPGSYVLLYKNAGGTVLARVPFTVVGEGNAAAGFTREASMQLSLNKSAYGAGDEISLNIQSPYTGTGLITIETDRVHAWKWFTATKTSSIETIAIPKGFEGKGFINVQFTRDLKSKEIFMSPLSFAVAPFTANVDAHDQKIVLSVPKDAKPGDPVTVEYHSRATGKIMLYAVDEGILQYAHYQNPDPLDYFLMKRGLEVSTSQIMDLLLPEYSLLKALSAAGGDGFANDGKNLNPFKRKTEPPVAYWSGIVETGPETRRWTFTVPPYFNGGVRVVAVAASTETMGVTQAGLSVHGPLIVTPNLPLFAAPGDTFIAAVTVANHIKNSGKDAKVRLDLEPSEQLEVLDAPKDALAIAEGDEQTVQIKLKATEALGSGSLRFTARLGEDRFTIEQTLSVRPPLPSMTSLISGYTKENTATVRQMRALYPQLASVHAAVSGLPVSLIGGLKEYLATYPYGCTEQMTSQNFPNVILYGNTELIKTFGWKPREMDSAIQRSFDQLRERQGSQGGWGMWNYYSEPHGFLTAYVMHFLLEAKEKNLAVPSDVFDTGLRYMKQVANEAPSSLEDAREKAYAIYVLTRAGEITTNYIPHLTGYLDDNYKDKWHDDLVAVYLAATYQQMQMLPEANALLDAFHLEAPVLYTTSWHDYAFYDSLTKYSQYLYLIARHFPRRLEVMDKAVVWRVANFVGEGTYDTLSSSYAVMAIDAYVNASKETLSGVTMHAAGADGKDQPLKVTGERLKVADVSALVASLTFASESPGFFYQVASSGYDKTLPDKPIEAGLELERSYLGADGKPVKSVKLGDAIDVVMTLRSGSSETIGNVAVVDLLPAGFELMPEARHAAEQEPKEDTDKKDDDADAPSAWQPAATDRREDRIVLYGTFAPVKETYRYRIRATSRGSFIVPPSYAQSMYDSALKVRGVAGSIEVQ
jgi:uncharacterized protein YfaS (alpha-2-macroglobulin family)